MEAMNAFNDITWSNRGNSCAQNFCSSMEGAFDSRPHMKLIDYHQRQLIDLSSTVLESGNGRLIFPRSK